MTKREIIESVVESAIARNRGAGQNFYIDYECDGRYGRGECLSMIDGVYAGAVMREAGAKPLDVKFGRFPRRGQKDLYVRREYYCFDWNSGVKENLVETLADDFMIDLTVSVDDEEDADELRKDVERRLNVEENYVGSDFDRKFVPFDCFDVDWYGYFVYTFPCLCYELQRVRDFCKKEDKTAEIQIEKFLPEKGWTRETVEITPNFGDDEIESLCKKSDNNFDEGIELSCLKVEDAE